MFKRLSTLLILLLVFQLCHSQQNNIWYFGRNAGLNFNAPAGQPVPTVLSDGAMTTNEGCASICDYNGNILFYSNGLTVYNRNHEVMLNGDGLRGNQSSVQACIIVPVPGNDSIYYIFTTDAIENNFANGYTYSIVNMKRDNGNGEVVTKNTLLWASCTERMVAVRHGNGKDVWLITNDNNSNIFRAWLIDCSGLRPSPVVSTTGVVMDQHILTNTGMMKVSPDSKQLCQTHFPEPDVTSFVPNFFQLFDFDNNTGQLSNPKSVTFPDSRVNSCEYSPDSKLLYFSSPDAKMIEQVEAKLVPAAAIVASRIRISTGTSRFYGMQLAPDGKIYLADLSSSIGAINNPDIKGTDCNFKRDQIILAPGGSTLGLPAYINDLAGSPDNGFSLTIVDSCTGRVQFNGFTTMTGIINWNWDFGDGNTSGSQSPMHVYTPSNQSYTVTLEITSVAGCGYVKRLRTIFPGGLAATAAFDFTSDCDAGTVSFINRSTIIPDSTGVHYLWTFGDGNTSILRDPVHTYPSGSYNVKLDVLTSTACLNRSTMQVLDLDIVNITTTADQEIDPGQSVQLNAGGGGNSFTWTPATWLSDPTIANPIATPGNNVRYKVVVRNDAGCSDSAYVNIKVMPFPGIYMPTGFTPNRDGLNDDIQPIITKEFTLHDFSIYNRWGERLFFTNQKNVGWNGQLRGLVQDSGIYVWTISATDNRSGKRIDKKGTFMIFR